MFDGWSYIEQNIHVSSLAGYYNMAEPNGEAESVEPLCQLLSGTRLQPAAEAAAEEESLVGGLSVLVGDLWAPRHVARVSRRLTALEFYRDYVSTSLPCIFTPQAGLLQHWRSVSLPCLPLGFVTPPSPYP